MNKIFNAFIGGAALILAGSASATVINGTGLQDALDGITIDGPGIDVMADQHEVDEKWQISASGGSVATMIIELSAYAQGNSFGVYDTNDPSKEVTLFAGSDSAGDQALLSIKADGSVFVNFADTGIDFVGNEFGFFLNTAVDNTWYSQTGLNADLDLDGEGDDHMIAYQGDDETTLQLPGYAPGIFSANEYILAWEDLPLNTADRDYTDFVVLVESVVGVPEPAAIAILGLGLAGLGVVARRRSKKA